MKKTLLFILIFTVSALLKVAAQCTNAPVINSFSPNTGFIGSTVTITGAYFESTPANNIVYFGATKATVTSASFGTLTVTVPVGASTAPISVTNACNLTGYSRVSFNGIFCPTPITSSTYNNTAFTLSGVYGAYNMIAQDMDLDGKPDVLSAYSGLTVARNTSTPGSLSFSAHNFGTGGNYNASVSTADFDGDGKRDVFTTHSFYRNTSTGAGNINFAITSSGFSGYQGNVGDFNNDGKIDVVYEGANGVMYFYRNTSSGPGNISFTYSTAISVNYRSTGIQCSDADGDGKTDVLSTQGDGNRMISIRNTTTPGATTFTFEGIEAWNSGGAYPYRCQIADFDKDGRIDLATVNYNSANNTVNTAVFRNTSSVGDISFATPNTYQGPNNNYRIGVGDVNGDGYPDIVTKSLAVQAFAVYQNTSSGAGNINFASRFDYSSAAAAEVSGIVIGDLDGDYVPDIATSGINSNTIRFHRNTSSQQDVTNPTAICKNITVALNSSGTVTVTAAMIDNGSSDACGIGSLLIDNNATKTFTCSNIGTNTVTLKVIDRANNVSTCTATITVAPAAIIVSGQTTVCDGQTVLLTANTGASYQWYKNSTAISGATNQTYTATTTGNYQVYVDNSGTGGCAGTSSVTAVTVNTNPTVSVTPSASTPLCNGVATLTATLSSIYQWKLNGNNIANATQQTYNATTTGTYSVQVIDLFGCTATSSGITVTNTPPEIDVTGNSNSIADGDNSPSSSDGTDFGTIGSQTSTFTITNSGSGSLTISSIAIGGADPSNFTIGGITLPAAINASGSTTFTVTFSLASLGTKTATVNILNNDCNEALYNFDIKGELSCTDPVFTTCPNDQTESTATGTCVANVSYTSVVSGIPTPNVTYEFTGATTGSGSGNGSGATFNKGVTTVTLSATNSCGTKTCSFDITINDNENPTIVTSASDKTVECDGSGNISDLETWLNNQGGASATDACGNVTWTNDYSALSNDCGETGSATVTFTAEDGSGNKSTTSATFKIEDTTKPIIVAEASNSTVECDGSGNTTALNDWLSINGGAVATDDCGSVTWTNDYTALSNDCGATGSATVTFTATDDCGNKSTTSATFKIEDTRKPIIDTEASNSTVECDGSGNTTALNAWLANNGGAAATDDCGDVTWTNDYSALSDDSGATGSATVTFTATDDCGNKSTTSATFKIEDTSKPTITTEASNSTVECDGSGNTTALNAWLNNHGGAAATDACGGVTWTNDYSALSNDCGATGSATVTFTATDDCGNKSTTTATFKIEDTTKPTITTVASNSVVNCDGSGNTSALNAWLNNHGGAAASDACGGVTWTNNYSALSDDCGATGRATVTFTATDDCGNKSTTTATFSIVDTAPPTITCPSDVTINCQDNSTSSNTGSASASDVCGGASISSSDASSQDANPANPGHYNYTITRTWSAADDCNNINICRQKITVQDITKPTAKCKPVTVTLVNGTASITAASIDDGSYDNCSSVSLSASKTTFNCTNIGDNTVVLTVTDVSGNVSTCNATVTVKGSIPTVTISQGVQPIFCQGGAVVLSTTVSENVTYAWSANANNSTSDEVNVYASGNYSVTVTNGNGCTATATSTVVYDASSLLSGYTIIATDEVELKEKSQVQTGGVGVFGCNGEIEVQGNSKITGSTTFAHAKDIDVTGGSTVTTRINSAINVTLPAFKYNPYCDNECKSNNHKHCNSECKDSKHKHCKSDCKERNHSDRCHSKYHKNCNSGCKNKNHTHCKSSCKENDHNHCSHSNCEDDDHHHCSVACHSKYHKNCNSGCKNNEHVHCKSNCNNSSHNHCGKSNCKGKNDVTVGSNKTVTLTDSIYGKIAIGKNSTVTFTQPVIYMKELKTSEDVIIKFTEACAVVKVCDDVELKDDNTFNSTDKSVVVFVEHDFTAKKNSTINASIYSLDKIKVEANCNNVTYMKGLFIAEEVKSNYAYWNWNTNCSSCDNLNKRTNFASDEAGLIDPLSVSLVVYPNPNKGDFGIDIVTNQTGDLKITISDLLGRTVYSQTQSLSGPVYLPISLPTAANGQYIIKAEVNGQLFIKNVMVNR